MFIDWVLFEYGLIWYGGNMNCIVVILLLVLVMGWNWLKFFMFVFVLLVIIWLVLCSDFCICVGFRLFLFRCVVMCLCSWLVIYMLIVFQFLVLVISWLVVSICCCLGNYIKCVISGLLWVLLVQWLLLVLIIISCGVFSSFLKFSDSLQGMVGVLLFNLLMVCCSLLWVLLVQVFNVLVSLGQWVRFGGQLIFMIVCGEVLMIL